jgi:hypothetical protein
VSFDKNIKLRSASGKYIADYNMFTRTIRKWVKESEHMLRTPQAWSYDTSLIQTVVNYETQHDNARLSGVSFEINATDTKKIYTVTWEIFQENSFKHNRAGEQLALTLNHWKVKGEDFEQLGFQFDI